MKYIKIFNEFDNVDILKLEIANKLSQFKISNFEINDDYTIDVDGDVDLSAKFVLDNNMKNMVGLEKIPFNFRNVSGDFIVYRQSLLTLEGSPFFVGGRFICADNLLTNLIGGPMEVGKDYYCNSNLLVTLDGLAAEIGGDLKCNNNQLTSLDTVSNIRGNIRANGNKIETTAFNGWCGGQIRI